MYRAWSLVLGRLVLGSSLALGLGVSGCSQPDFDATDRLPLQGGSDIELPLDSRTIVSRVARGRITLQRAPVGLAAVVRQAVETNRGLIDERRHERVLHH